MISCAGGTPASRNRSCRCLRCRSSGTSYDRVLAPDAAPPPPDVPVSPLPSSPRYTTWLSAVVIVAAIIAAFGSALRTPFQYDDLSSVVENVTIRDLSALRTVLSPVADVSPTAGRPVLNVSFAVDYAIAGLDVLAYHATNVALHVLCALLLYAVVRSTLRLPAAASLGRHRDIIAVMVAAIWAVHPLQSGAVTYISGRSDVLVGLWFMATLYAAIRAQASARQSVWTLAAIGACAMGMDSVENVANWDFIRDFKNAGRAQFRDRYPAAGNQADAKFLVVGEELETPPELLSQQRLDGLWNEPFQRRVRAALLGESVDGRSFEETVRRMIDCRMDGVFDDGARAVNYLTSHDVEGFRKERLYNFMKCVRNSGFLRSCSSPWPESVSAPNPCSTADPTGSSASTGCAIASRRANLAEIPPCCPRGCADAATTTSGSGTTCGCSSTRSHSTCP